MCRMFAPRPGVASLSVLLLLSTGIAAFSRLSGFPTPVAAIVGAVTLTVGYWASASEP
jgi:hypothetical protein